MATPGMEVLFSSVLTQISTQADAFVCAVHWGVVADGFKCIGNGEETPANVKVAKRTELLPREWNEGQGVYSLLYVPEASDNVHILKIIQMEGQLLVHFLRTSDEEVTDMTVNITDYISEDLSSFESAYTNLPGLQKKLKQEVLSKLKGESKSQTKASQASTSQQERQDRRRDEDDPLRVPPRHGQRQPRPEWGDPDNPFGVGRGDLDPLSGGMGGGMYMDPMRSGFPGRGIDPDAGLPGRLPRGAVPPGARFDPFGPPDPDRSGSFNPNPRGGRRPGPDPDHMPPPGFDDMFM